MSSVKIILSAAALGALAVSQAQAADMPRPPVVYQPAPVPVIQEFDGWYLRGDIGMTNQQVKSLDNALFASTSSLAWIDEPGFGTGLMMGLGIGYQYNEWLRFDVTGEYRGKTQFHALDRFNNGGVINTNDYSAKKSEWLFLANTYVDLGTWWCITPFVGVGVGLVDITISHFRDNNIIAGGGGYANDESKVNFAWALHAGLAYKVNQNFAVEFGYRYLNLGDAQSGDIINYNGTNTVTNPMLFKDITSHDFKLGLRWMCCDDGTTLRKTVYARPQPAYAQPIYAQPPQQVLALPPTYAPPPPAPVYSQPPQYVPPPPPVYSQPPAYPQQGYPPQQQPMYPQQQPYSQPPLNRRG